MYCIVSEYQKLLLRHSHCSPIQNNSNDKFVPGDGGYGYRYGQRIGELGFVKLISEIKYFLRTCQERKWQYLSTGKREMREA